LLRPYNDKKQRQGELKFAPTRGLRSEQALESAAREAKEMVEHEG